jgi:hypothetical protein
VKRIIACEGEKSQKLPGVPVPEVVRAIAKRTKRLYHMDTRLPDVEQPDSPQNHWMAP